MKIVMYINATVYFILTIVTVCIINDLDLPNDAFVLPISCFLLGILWIYLEKLIENKL